jgi:Ca-activated chloride channel family protein
MYPTKRALLFLILLLFVLFACGGEATEEAPLVEDRQVVAETVEVEGQPVEVTRLATEITAEEPMVEEFASPYAPATPEPPVDNVFRDYGVNPFVDASVDPLSTFALDVDTGAYTIARRYLQDGQMPPRDAVRVEEFVNYFDQGYASPPSGTFSIYADGALSPFHSDSTTLLRIGIQGYEVSATERRPASLTFVIDVSGSMSGGNRLEMVKDALGMLVEQLRPDDTVAIVVYGDNARVVLPSTSGREQGQIFEALYRLQSEGSTNAEAGLNLGYQTANQSFKPGGTNRVILASDGVANVGLTNPDILAEQVKRYAGEGIQLTTIGVGMGNFNDVLMEQLADNGDGHYAYVDTLAEAHRVFVEELTGTLQVIALDAKVQVDFNPQVVTRYRLVGYENRAVADQDFRNDSVDAGEIGAGHTAVALYALQMQPAAEGRVATVQLRWRNPQSGQVEELHGDINSWDLQRSFEETDSRFQLTAVVAQFAELLRDSYWTADTRYADVAAYASRLAAELPGDVDVLEFARLAETAARIRP